MAGTSKKVRVFLGSRFVSLGKSLNVEGKKGFMNFNNLRFGKKSRGLIVFAIVAIVLVSILPFLLKGNQATPDIPQSTNSPTDSPTAVPQETTQPTSPPDPFSQIRNIAKGLTDPITRAVTPKAPGTIETAGAMNSSVWHDVAANAWKYFQPDTGVDPNTGLPRGGGTDAPNFTDWDLGVYIQAVIDAQKIGVIGTDGAWNFSQRLEIVVNFLETRDLNSYNYPFWFYQAKDGKSFNQNSDVATTPVDGADTGRLFVALNNLRVYNSSLASRINAN